MSDELVDWKEMCRQLTIELGERNKRIATFKQQISQAVRERARSALLEAQLVSCKAELAKVSRRLGDKRNEPS
jgi:hypothetical protein